MRQFVIKKTLRSICPDDNLIVAINSLAENVSKMQTLASHHLYKRTMEIIESNNPDRIRNEFDREVKDQMFHDDFFAVKANTVNPVADAEFLEWVVTDRGIQLPVGAYTNQPLNHSIKMYKTNYSNHIKMHSKKMFRAFCKAVLKRFYRQRERWFNEQIKRAVEYFYYFTNYRPSRPIRIIIEEFNQFIRIDNENIVRGFMNNSLDGGYFYRFAKYFIKMQLYIHQYNDAFPNRRVAAIKVIPLHNFHRRCVMIDTLTLRQLTCMRCETKAGKRNPKKSDVWTHFDLSKVNKKNQYFDHKIMTDGITANILMMKSNVFVDLDLPDRIKGAQMRVIEQPVREQQFDRIPPEVIQQIDQFDVQMGIDPGARTMAAVTKRFPDGSEECMSITSFEYKEMTGFRRREYKRRGITGEFDRMAKEQREASLIPISSKGRHYRQYVQHILDMCEDGWEAYHRPSVIRLKFDAYIFKLKAMYAVAKRIIGYLANGELNNALIFFGHWRWKSNSPISGIRTPLRLLRFCLQQLGSTVIVVNEFRTSKLCNLCSQTMINNLHYSLCIDCHPIPRTLTRPAVWRIKAHKSYLERNPGANKIRTFEREPNQPMRQNNRNHCPMMWNRDYNASRSILSKGLDLIAGQPLPQNFLQTTRNVVQRQRFVRL